MPIDHDLLSAIDRVIIAVHGVRSRGEWAATLHTQLRQDPRFDRALFLTFDYPVTWMVTGWFLTWIPWVRHRLTNLMQRKLRQVRSRYPGRPISIVCHSNGTWVVGHAIRRSFQTTKPLGVQTLILVGGVLANVTVCELANGQMAGKLCNYWSSNDRTVRMAPPPFGKCGLVPSCNGNPLVINRGDWKLGHSGYWNSSAVYRAILEDLAV